MSPKRKRLELVMPPRQGALTLGGDEAQHGLPDRSRSPKNGSRHAGWIRRIRPLLDPATRKRRVSNSDMLTPMLRSLGVTALFLALASCGSDESDDGSSSAGNGGATTGGRGGTTGGDTGGNVSGGNGTGGRGGSSSGGSATGGTDTGGTSGDGGMSGSPTGGTGGTTTPPTACAYATPSGDVFYVATAGNDDGDGSEADPWATITHAVENVPDGSTILVRPGDYEGRVELDGVFPLGIVVRSEEPYQARLRNTGAVVTSYYGEGITLEGFDIAHSGPGGALVIQIQNLRDDGDVTRDIVI